MKKIYFLFLSLIFITICKYSTAQNVGVGTAAPDAKLEIRTTGNTASSKGFEIINSSGTSMFIVRDDQRTGIGTTTLSERLNIGGNIRMVGSDRRIGTFSNHSFFLTSNNQNRIALMNNGFVGIGNMSPSYPLDISGNTNIDGNLRIEPGNIIIHRGDGSISSGQSYTMFRWHGYNTGHTLELGYDYGSPYYFETSESSRDIEFRNAQSGSWIYMRGSNSNVGIGVTSPTERLDVQGNLRVRALSSGYVRSNNNGVLSVTPTIPWSDLTGVPPFDDSKWNQNGNNIYNKNSGNVGIGTGSPDERLHVEGNFKVQTSAGSMLIEPLGGASTTFTLSGSPRWNFQGTAYRITADGDEVMTILNNGNIGIGNAAPQATLHLVGGSNSGNVRFDHTDNRNAGGVTDGMAVGGTEIKAIDFHYTGSSQDYVYAKIATKNYNTAGTGWYSTTARYNAGLSFYVSNTGTLNERITIRDNGNVGISNTNPSYRLHVNGRIRSDGITESSDERLKDDINDLKESLAKVLALRGVSYTWNEKSSVENQEKGLQIGLIAQEVEKILPEVVDADEEGIKSVHYSVLVALLIEAIKEQQEMIQYGNSQYAALTEVVAEIQSEIKLQRKLIEIMMDNPEFRSLLTE
ncbi:MAG: tail fiber domain-containing protein [Chitinophagaceae bacterium]|nr:MAG: tail fiber domain-containing protein [Chitinophagaceae bacterium]